MSTQEVEVFFEGRACGEAKPFDAPGPHAGQGGCTSEPSDPGRGDRPKLLRMRGERIGDNASTPKVYRQSESNQHGKGVVDRRSRSGVPDTVFRGEDNIRNALKPHGEIMNVILAKDERAVVHGIQRHLEISLEDILRIVGEK